MRLARSSWSCGNSAYGPRLEGRCRMRRELHVRFCEGGGVRFPSATRLVVLCRRNAVQALEVVRRWMTLIGLALNEDKTCVRNAREESFDFLSYSFGTAYSPRTGGRYLAAAPSKKALRRLRENIRGRLRSGNHAPVQEVVKSLNRVPRGWSNYFCYGTVSKAWRVVDAFVYDNVRHFLRRRHKVGTRGIARAIGGRPARRERDRDAQQDRAPASAVEERHAR